MPITADSPIAFLEREPQLSPLRLQEQKERSRIWDGIKFDYESWEDYQADREQRLTIFEHEVQERIRTWLSLAKSYTSGEDPDLGCVNSPPFDELSFQQCNSLEQLADGMRSDFWMPGDSFFLDDLCVVNKSRDASLWLLIKEDKILGDLHFYDRKGITADLARELRSAICKLAGEK